MNGILEYKEFKSNGARIYLNLMNKIMEFDDLKLSPLKPPNSPFSLYLAQGMCLYKNLNRLSLI